jgi:aminoglycoside phosphotransferase (APT) family kinase protein
MGQMHADEVAIDEELVRRLLRSQHARWADLPLRRVESAGTEHAMFRLGEDLAVRLPRVQTAVEGLLKEREWLPRVAPKLSLLVPRPIATGTPEGDYPFPWAVVEWLPGDLATLDRLNDPSRAARDLAGFVTSLQRVDPWPAMASWANRRAGPVRRSDGMVRVGLAGLDGEVDAVAVAAAWETVLSAPDYAAPPVWFHGDLMSFNLVASEGRLTGVLDWGACGVGDPAIDMTIAWTLLPAEARAIYREALAVDDGTWLRGMGWVLEGVFGIVYYRHSNPLFVAHLVHGIEAVLADLHG